ncbi:hypothetical protein Y032_0439g1500 [Ancylostoma ceylanicum]|uniref:Uncharacterized protein n=1 Tax=Ancylostoma ceylanicum TaxID=53326 RepID=A0A016WZ61_9BILA|nr:hypothetical protein Y032_0439g1500 [Ancylostoma ceylanicum]
MVGFRRDDELIGSGEGCETRRKTGDECTVFRVSKCRRVFHSGYTRVTLRNPVDSAHFIHYTIHCARTRVGYQVDSVNCGGRQNGHARIRVHGNISAVHLFRRRLDCVVVQLMYCTEFHDCFCGNIHLGVIEGGDHEYDIHLT